MSDPLSVTASIVALIGAGFTIAKGLHQLADSIGTAGQEVRIYADEIDAFSRLLDLIREFLQRRSQHSYSRAENLLEDILNICQRVLEPMESIQATLTPLLSRFSSSPGKFRQFAFRIQWIFSTKDKLLFYRAALKGQHRLLDTTLIAMHLTAEGNNSQIAYNQRRSIQHCMAGIRRSLNDSKHLQLGGVLQPTIQLLTSSSGNASTWKGVSAGSAVLLTNGNKHQQISYTAGLASQTSSGDREPNLENNSSRSVDAVKATGDSQALMLSPLREQESNENLDDQDMYQIDDVDEIDEINEIDKNIDKTLDMQFEDSGQEIWEDMRAVSRKVLQYATDVLGAAPTASEGSDGPSEAPSQSPLSGPDPQSGMPLEDPKSDSQYFVLDNKHGSLRLPSSQIENMRIHYGEDGVSLEQQGRSRESSPMVPPVSDTITLKNFDGKTYQVPYASVREWMDMKSVFLSLRYPQLFRRDSRQGSVRVTPDEILDKEEFELISPEGHCIVPQLWTQTLQPGWTIELRFNDNITWEDEKSFRDPRRESLKESSEQLLNSLPTQSPKKPSKPSEGRLRIFGKLFRRRE